MSEPDYDHEEEERFAQRLANYVPPHLRNPDDTDVVHLQWNSGWGFWEQVVDEAAAKPGVVAFRRLTPKGT